MTRVLSDSVRGSHLRNRRGFAAPTPAAAQSSKSSPARVGRTEDASRPAQLIDVHHHIFPPALQAALKSILSPFQLTDTKRSLGEMRSGRVATSIISYPNDVITRWPAARLAALLQQANDEAAEMVALRPRTYGLFASLPMPYVGKSLRELERLYKQLGAHFDGILLLTSYGNRWLGHPSFAPLMSELNSCRAVVFVHPRSPPCCCSFLPQLHPSVIEYETDTVRTIADLIFSGTIDRFPDIQWLFSHGGGTMPSLVERLQTAQRPSPRIIGQFANPPETYLRGFYYDTAQSAHPVIVRSLLGIVPASQVCFGTDFPYRRAAEQSDALRAMHFLSNRRLERILWGNTQRLLPRLRAVAPS